MQCFLAMSRLHDAVALVLERFADATAGVVVVVDDEDSAGAASPNHVTHER
jgi:hypothetical protein